MPPDWPKLEAEFARLPRREVVNLAARAAERLAPVLAQAADHYGPEAFEWLHAVAATVRTARRYAAGEPVTRFALDLASDAARCAANAMAGAAQLLGPAAAHEACENAMAAAAFAADCARAKSPAQAAQRAVQAVRVAGAVPPATGPLWPDGEPAWFAQGLDRYRRAFPPETGIPPPDRGPAS